MAENPCTAHHAESRRRVRAVKEAHAAQPNASGVAPSNLMDTPMSLETDNRLSLLSHWQSLQLS